MSDNAGLAPGANGAAPASDGDFSINDAVASLVAAREQGQTQAVEDDPPADDAIPARDEPAPDESQPSGEDETAQDDPPVEEPDPIEPPRSWTKEEKERFKALPRETQEFLAKREQDRETTFRRGQNETAEQRKKAEAEVAEARKLREHYESALPTLLQNLNDAYAGEFADIKTMADVQKLAEEDFVRYAKWDAHQKRLAHVATELKIAQERQQNEQREAFANFAKEQDKLFEEAAPEFGDREKAPKARKLVNDYISSLGVNQDQLAALWNGEQTVSIRHHAVQRMLYDAARYQAAQAALKATPKPAPAAQKPGAAPAKNAGLAAKIREATERLDRTGDPMDALALTRLKRQAAAS